MRAWVEARTGVGEALAACLLPRLPARANSWLSLGGILLLVLALQLVTGVLLLFYFVPDTDRAFESVRQIAREVPYGWLVQLLHTHGANWMVALAALHLLRVAFVGAYKEPRELVWVVGCLLFLLTLGAALTGYILPWSQMSYWATTVVTASFEYIPFVGHDALRAVRGGDIVGPATFSRAFAAHVSLIPLAMLALVAMHLALVRRAGLSTPPRRAHAPAEPEPLRPFYPDFALRYALQAVGFLLVLFALLFFVPNLFFPYEHLLPADPFDTPPDVKPEWYFLWAYELPRLLPEWLALPLQGLALAVLFALPFLDRGPHRHPRDRPWIVGLLGLGVVVVVALSILGALA